MSTNTHVMITSLNLGHNNLLLMILQHHIGIQVIHQRWFLSRLGFLISLSDLNILFDFLTRFIWGIGYKGSRDLIVDEYFPFVSQTVLLVVPLLEVLWFQEETDILQFLVLISSLDTLVNDLLFLLDDISIILKVLDDLNDFDLLSQTFFSRFMRLT